MQSQSNVIREHEGFVPILFSGYVKKLSRRLRVWQQRILTLNAQGDIYIRRVNAKFPSSVIPSSCPCQQQSNKGMKPPIRITDPGVVTRQGQASDGKWPRKLDLKQSLVLECDTTIFLFFPSTHAAETLTTQLRILCCKRDSEEGTDVSIELNPRSKKVSWSDDLISRDEREKLTLLTGPGRKESFSFISLLEFSDSIRDSISSQSLLTENEKKENTEEKVEMCFDFTSGPGYLACKRAKHSSLSPHQSKPGPESLLPFLPPTQFSLKPILKRNSRCYNSEKSDTLSRVRFNTSPSVRILSVMTINSKQEIETEYDQIVSLYVGKYVVKGSKQTRKSK